MQTLREELWEDFLKSVMQWYEMQRKHTFSSNFYPSPLRVVQKTGSEGSLKDENSVDLK